MRHVVLQKHSTQVVSSQSACTGSSSRKSAHGIPPQDQQDLPSSWISNVTQDVCECGLLYASKVAEREELERKVADIKKGPGIISLPKSAPDEFQNYMDFFKQSISRDGKVFWLLKAAEEAYKSEESKCRELRKILEVHNLKSIPESLMDDGNKMTGRRRTNEKERLPLVLEICPTEERIVCSMPTEVSACDGPLGSPLVHDVMPYGEKGIAMPSVMEMDKQSTTVAPYECFLNENADEGLQTSWNSLVDPPVYTGYQMENEDGRPAEVCVNNNTEMSFSDDWSGHWTDALFATDQS